jgi:hypothetical protein
MPRASAVEEAATSKPTTATNDKIFVIDLAPPFPLSPFATQFSEQLVAYENGGGLDLFIFLIFRGISVHDHIILGKSGHASFKGMRLIQDKMGRQIRSDRGHTGS